MSKSSLAREITSEALDELIQSVFADKFAADSGIRYGDEKFYLPQRREIQQILGRSQLDRKQWLQERHDCDDFAYVLKGEFSAHAYDAPELCLGLCAGILWGYFDWTGDQFHAINWFVASDETLWLIEPQTDDIYPASRCTGGISLLLV